MSEATRSRATAEEREAAILTQVQQDGFASITALSHTLAVSDMTIRRDVRKLAGQGELRIVHGGVSRPHGTLTTATFTGRAEQEADAKRLIVDAALALVEPGSTIAIDSGTTCYAVASRLDRAFAGCVITHSVPVLHQMLNYPSATVIGLGGELMTQNQVLLGPTTTAAAAALSISTVFLGANSLDERGVYLHSSRERPVKSALMDSSGRVVLLVDSSKLAHTAPVRLTTLDALDVVITNGKVPVPLRSACRSAGVELVVV